MKLGVRPCEVSCDYPVERYKSGKKKGEWKTCDRKMCERCARAGNSPNVHFCKGHFRLAKAAFERRQAAEKQKELFNT